MISKYAVFGLLSIIILCCILKKEKEGYTILGEDNVVKIGSSYSAGECQNECEKDITCKYVNRSAKLKNHEKGDCWKSTTIDQDTTGQKGKGNNNIEMVTWENKNYVQPKESIYHSSIGGYNFKTREEAKEHCKSNGLQLCHSEQLKLNKKDVKKGANYSNVCNSGWTTDTRGWWVGRWIGTGCGGHGKKWDNWHKWSGSSAHCCTKGPLK